MLIIAGFVIECTSANAASLTETGFYIVDSQNPPSENTQDRVSVNPENAGFSGTGNNIAQTEAVPVNVAIINEIITYCFVKAASANTIATYASSPDVCFSQNVLELEIDRER